MLSLRDGTSPHSRKRLRCYIHPMTVVKQKIDFAVDISLVLEWRGRHLIAFVGVYSDRTSLPLLEESRILRRHASLLLAKG
jgi:hypothetical protein